MALKSSKQLDEERRKASRFPARLGTSADAGLQPPKTSPVRKRGLTTGLVAAGAMTIFGFSAIDRQPQQPCEPNPNGDQTCPQGSSSSRGGGSRGFFSSWGASSGASSGSYWGGHSSGTSGSSNALVAHGGFGSTGGFHASSGG